MLSFFIMVQWWFVLYSTKYDVVISSLTFAKSWCSYFSEYWWCFTIWSWDKISLPEWFASPLELSFSNYIWNLDVLTSNTSDILDLWVSNFKIQKRGLYFFWHSSPVNESTNAVFKNLNLLWRGDNVSVSFSDDITRKYNYSDTFIINPVDIDKLVEWDDFLYLITCYPEGSNQFRLIKKFEYRP